MHISRGRRHWVHKKTLFCLFFFMFVFLIALWCFELCLVSMLCCSYCIMFVLDMHTSLCYCASLNACSNDHLLYYVIIVVISLWLFWCMIKLLIYFTSWLLDRFLLVTLYLSFYFLLVLLFLTLPWGSNLFCASVSSYKYICSKFITTSRFRCEWVLSLFPNSGLSLESVLGCFVTE